MERRSDTEQRTSRSSSATVVDARTTLALWLRAGRAQRGLSIEDVARVTKIQPRILDLIESGRLESGKPDGLPADVFVRGFVRSFARCVGLDENEALERYVACGASDSSIAKGPPRPPASVHPKGIGSPGGSLARAMVEAMADLAPDAALAAGSAGDLPIVPIVPEHEVVAPEVVAPEVVVEEPVVMMAPPADVDLTSLVEAPIEAVDAKPKKKRTKRATVATTEPKPRTRKRKSIAIGTPSEPMPVVGVIADASSEPASVEAEPQAIAEPIDAVVDAPTVVEAAGAETATVTEMIEVASYSTATESIESTTDATATHETEDVQVPAGPAWTPRMPVLAASMPWRRSNAAPALVAVIDDEDPDSAERVLEERRGREAKRTFLPPILLDREDRSTRQGGLTLAVIILLIAATLTLSYLMRRPSASGDGVTQTAAESHDFA